MGNICTPSTSQCEEEKPRRPWQQIAKGMRAPQTVSRVDFSTAELKIIAESPAASSIPLIKEALVVDLQALDFVPNHPGSNIQLPRGRADVAGGALQRVDDHVLLK